MGKANPGGAYNKRDLLGQRFGRLVVIEDYGFDKWNLRKWLCKCDCGTIKPIHARNLIIGRTQSCKCLQKDFVAKLTLSHGMATTPEYNSWKSMIARCDNPTSIGYGNYGERGIRVAPEWYDFKVFYEAVGPRPGPNYTIDRIDNDGNYEPRNVRWATRKQQQRNKRDTVLFSFRGEAKTLIEWAEIFHIQYATLRQRLKANWPIERALTEPVRPRRR